MSWFDYICTTDELLEVLQKEEIQELIIGYQIYGNYQVKIGYGELEEDLRKNLSITIWFGQEPRAMDPRTRIETGRYAGACHLSVPEFLAEYVEPGAIAYDDKLIEYDVPPARPAYMLVRRALKKACPHQTTGDNRIGGPFPRVSNSIRDQILKDGFIRGRDSRYYFERPPDE